MRVLHIHQDYPDGRLRPSTKAVQNLIHASKAYDNTVEHYVLSINRTSNPFKISVKSFEEGLSIVYWAIPLPYIYIPMIWFCTIYMAFVLRKQQFDLIHGHKLTTEGVFAYFLSKRFKIRYVLSARGGSDSHNFSRLPQHKSFFEKICKKAATIFWVSAWAKNSYAPWLNLNKKLLADSYFLPNICDISLEHKNDIEEVKSKFITAISFHQYKRKGVIEVIQAITNLKSEGVYIFLDIYGSGEKKYIHIIQKIICDNKVEDLIKIKGEVTQQQLIEVMKVSKGFLMPSINETFGMVYVEALSVGCPILYVENTGIDGHLDDVFVGMKIAEQTVDKIKLGIKSLNDDANKYQQKILEVNERQYLNKFTKNYIARSYLEVITKV